ncbi:MAG: isochorismatase family cysteine hydrolase [Polyangia bacterium]|jgi:nicotinamidase-related amidase
MKTFNGVDIYENLKEIVEPSRSCLVVWDVQQGLVNSIFNKEAFLASLKTLVDGVRGRMPVAYTLITPLPQAYQSGWSLLSMMRRFRIDDPAELPVFMAKGSPEREIPEIVKPQPGDLQIEKASANIFLGTNFELMMKNRGVKSLIFTGIATEMGVELSARDAAARGFYPVIATDCVSSMNKDSHDRSLANLARLTTLASSGEILACY